ncbi:16S rRNA (adenine(1518)-N(6)/adenine(1519)-N(6))-dimethyltransferase RsmA [Methyloligella sp. 2.7D]|uniref:16S rRNA (adenine(1518)-N(6)/adenine(1519)-N(6))- dimethyltransferase RsmA n=1 Tax=unclassified Methyloligella TaxID=2625955 RepID=UPI00157D9A14|nr:16S rRNA (adenine(1518)-N(6)/adenine(1519)-N(6))-dimethyltransferase RsmA [Methyloligella sp. GL2]QKP77471.1 16S rRNA (adenine(1518)-N(6)/adenine(1519)-N(6))-dimethyltransferase RsmA [Methyloligella sp. GL2]
MSAPDGLPPLREVIAALDLQARKSLGQNFLLDLNLTRRIARAAAPLEDAAIVEVGPGPGGLTRALLMEGAKRVIAIEKDERCLPALAQIADAYPDKLEVVRGDATEIDYGGLGLEPPARIAANLPYSVATPLLIGWLKTAPWPPWFDRMVLMFQKEVALRIVAEPGSKDYGRLSVLANWRCRTKILFGVPASAFTPKPKVDSAIVELIPRDVPEPACKIATLEKVTAAAFGQRRKMLRGALRGLDPDIVSVLEGLGIAPTARAEELPVEAFCRIANALDARR